MSADDFLWLVTQAVFLAVFVDVSIRAVRRPRQAHIDIALFFAAILMILAISDVERLFGLTDNAVLLAATYIGLSALPYLALRIVDDFAPQPAWLMRVSSVGVGLLVVAAVFIRQPWPTLLGVVPIAWFIVIGGYASFEFLRQAHRASGVTSRRMVAAAAGSALIGLLFLLLIVSLIVPATAPVVGVAVRVGQLAAGLAYFLGFSPPAFLRRAWQEPELRAFLARAASLPRLQNMQAIAREMERGAATSTGAPAATIGFWDAERGRVVYRDLAGEPWIGSSAELIADRAFNEQRPVFSDNPARDDPQNAEVYQDNDVGAILAAPISAGEKHIGVLAVYAPRAPIFADDDLRLVQLLADQAAVVLESRSLIDEASRVQAREEATRLKDDFLSAAAHDLRSPLTTLLLHAEMMKRTLRDHPDAPAEERRINTIVREGNRLKSLVTDFLDAARAERGRLHGRVEEVDLVSLASETGRRLGTRRHPVRIDAPAAVIGRFGADRLRQLLDSLVENAIKYSPNGGEVVVSVGEANGEALLAVSDAGIGIPADDLAHLFDRFHRGANVDDRRFQGLGLGLYICRAIVDDHGGRIWAESTLGSGTTFHVVLPLNHEEPASSADDATSTQGAGAPAPVLAREPTPGIADA
jgi:signal transduction histidine kinase